MISDSGSKQDTMGLIAKGERGKLGTPKPGEQPDRYCKVRYGRIRHGKPYHPHMKNIPTWFNGEPAINIDADCLHGLV